MTETEAESFWRRSSSYTLSGAPRALDQAFQSLLRRSVIERIARVASTSTPFERALDLGCAIGDWTVAYTAIAKRVIGIDINEEFIARGRPHASSRKNVELVVANISEWTDFDMDFVAMGSCAMYLDDASLARVLDRVAAGLRAGGWLYFRASTAPPGKPGRQIEYGFYRTRQTYEEHFRARGFRIVDSGLSTDMVMGMLARHRLVGVRKGIAALLTAKHALLDENEFSNWILRRG